MENFILTNYLNANNWRLYLEEGGGAWDVMANFDTYIRSDIDAINSCPETEMPPVILQTYF